MEDSGMYECQVSTQPVRSYFVHLLVGGKTFFKIKMICTKQNKTNFNKTRGENRVENIIKEIQPPLIVVL